MFRLLPTLIMALLLLPLHSDSALRRQSVDTLLQRAELLDAQKTYGAAADAYERALTMEGMSAEHRDTVEYRFVVALGKAQRWDRALETGLAFAKRHHGTVWKPRLLYWLGRLYVAVPHQGWSVGKRFFRGENAPAGTFAEKPAFRRVDEQDLRNARDAFEAARTLYPRYRSVDPSETHDEIQLDFDLAHLLNAARSLNDWEERRDWAPPADPVWRIDPTAPYSTSWAPPKKQMFLFESAAEIAGSDRHEAALALLDKALWLLEYHALMHSYAVRWQGGKRQQIPYPYQDVTPINVLQEILRNPRYADESVRDAAELKLVTVLVGGNRLTVAEHELIRFLDVRSHSRLAVVARRQLASIRHKELSLGPLEPVQLPGLPARIRVAYRNVDRIRIRVFRLRFQDVYQDIYAKNMKIINRPYRE